MATKGKLPVDPNSEAFMKAARDLYNGSDDQWTNGDETWDVTRIEEPTQFGFHQRIFEPGMLMELDGTNVRVYLPAEDLK